jgi:hypothetical protein
MRSLSAGSIRLRNGCHSADLPSFRRSRGRLSFLPRSFCLHMARRRFWTKADGLPDSVAFGLISDDQTIMGIWSSNMATCQALTFWTAIRLRTYPSPHEDRTPAVSPAEAPGCYKGISRRWSDLKPRMLLETLHQPFIAIRRESIGRSLYHLRSRKRSARG